MEQKQQNKLFEKYPKIFSKKDLSIQESCMGLGITCGDGWFELIDVLCYCLQRHSDHTGNQIVAEQVKSKFGSLRFYTNSADPYVCGMIKMAETISHTINEVTWRDQPNDWDCTPTGESNG